MTSKKSLDIGGDSGSRGLRVRVRVRVRDTAALAEVCALWKGSCKYGPSGVDLS